MFVGYKTSYLGYEQACPIAGWSHSQTVPLSNWHWQRYDTSDYLLSPSCNYGPITPYSHAAHSCNR